MIKTDTFFSNYFLFFSSGTRFFTKFDVFFVNSYCCTQENKKMCFLCGSEENVLTCPCRYSNLNLQYQATQQRAAAWFFGGSSLVSLLPLTRSAKRSRRVHCFTVLQVSMDHKMTSP
jgi:hypothetical protein